MNTHGSPVDTDGKRRVPAVLLMQWMHRLLRWVDLIGSARALAASLGGTPLVPPRHIPRSPVLDQEEELAAELPTPDRIRNFVATWLDESA